MLVWQWWRAGGGGCGWAPERALSSGCGRAGGTVKAGVAICWGYVGVEASQEGGLLRFSSQRTTCIYIPSHLCRRPVADFLQHCGNGNCIDQGCRFGNVERSQPRIDGTAISCHGHLPAAVDNWQGGSVGGEGLGRGNGWETAGIGSAGRPRWWRIITQMTRREQHPRYL